MEANKVIFFGLKIWQFPKSHGKNQLKPFSDVFECLVSKSKVTLVPKKFLSGTRKHVGFGCL